MLELNLSKDLFSSIPVLLLLGSSVMISSLILGGLIAQFACLAREVRLNLPRSYKFTMGEKPLTLSSSGVTQVVSYGSWILFVTCFLTDFKLFVKIPLL